MSRKNEIFIFENLDHFWEITPYIFRNRFSTPTPWRKPHVHKELTFLFVFDGNIELKYEEKNITVGKDDLVCINPFFSHAQRILTESNYIRIIISSSFLSYNGFDPSTISLEPLVHDEKIREIMAEMINEFNNPDAYHRAMMNSLILGFVTYMLRNYSCKNNVSKKGIFLFRESDFEHVEKAINYISSNFKTTITLENLSEVSGLSKFYFTRVFKKYTGTSPLDYVNNMRCSYAKQLILNGSSITQAALDSGFNNTSYFTLCFKKHKGCLPSEVVNRPR